MNWREFKGIFLWGRHADPSKLSLIAWDKVCSAVGAGGVGIKRLRAQNDALLGKWLWRYSTEDNSLWKQLITTKYGVEKGGWSTIVSPNPYGLSLWKGIRKLWPCFKESIVWKLGSGDCILFWKHRWLDIGSLEHVFPAIYTVAEDQNAWIKDYCVLTEQGGSWSVKLRRNLNDWELEEYMQLLELLQSMSCFDAADSLCWSRSKDGLFNVRSFYGVMNGEEVDNFPWLMIWKAKAPSRVVFFTWCVVRGRTLTLDNLKLRGYSLANRCHFV